MSTEQQPTAATAPAPAAPAPAAPHATNPTEPKAEPNALAQALTGGWEKFKQGQLISYPLMALVLLLVTGVGVTWWIVREKRAADSAKWVELDATTGTAALEEFAKKYPDTRQARIANLEIARAQLGPDGIDKLTAANPEARKGAVASVEKAREAFTKLVDEFKDDPVLKVECMLALAKAEAVLVGMPKEGQLEQFRGDPKKAIEWLDKVAEAAPDTDWGKDAKKLSDSLKNQNTEQQVRTLQTMVYDVSPALPGFGGPLPPGFPGLGGPPGGGSPFGP